MSALDNPFRPARWEHHSDGPPLIWFAPTADLLVQDKSVYVHGSRGSGKTTLLRSICWEDLLYNPSLKLQRTLGDFKNIGIYIRFPDHISSSLGYLEWQKHFPDAPQPDIEFFKFFSLAVELICAEKALSATHELRINGRIGLSAGQELQLVADVVAEFPQISAFAEHAPNTFADLARTCRNLVRRINEASGRGTVGSILPHLPAREPYEFLDFIVERISRNARLKAAHGEIAFGFKFCLDDCEVLNELQKKSINTLVRKSRFPISWIVSTAGSNSDIGDTFIAQQPLTDADRRVLSLDDRDRSDFKALCEAVCSLRTYFCISAARRPEVTAAAITSFFPLEARLGTQDVNDIIGQMLRRSASPLARLVQSAAMQLRAAMWKVSPHYELRFKKSESRYPFYEAYVLLHWTGREDSFRTTTDEEHIPGILEAAVRFRDGSFQAWMRRKMVGALLHLSSRLGFKRIPYAGVEVIVSLADGSIRDFLEIMAEIYEKYVQTGSTSTSLESPAEHFARSRTKIANKVQTAGIASASESFVAGISIQNDPISQAVSVAVEALGKHTHHLQANPDDPSALGRAERGIFIFDPDQK